MTGVTLLEFDQMFWHQKISVPMLPCSIVCLISWYQFLHNSTMWQMDR